MYFWCLAFASFRPGVHTSIEVRTETVERCYSPEDSPALFINGQRLSSSKTTQNENLPVP